MTQVRAIALALLLSAATARGEQELHEVSWTRLKTTGALKVGEVLSADEQTPWERLRVTHPEGQEVELPLLSIQNPRVTTKTFALRGRVRCEGVEGKGHLDMWVHFPSSGPFYSKGVTGSGPTRRLTGTTGWRFFVLPFYIVEGEELPSRIDLNLVLPGRGTVELGPVSLLQFRPGEDPLRLPGQWWGEREAGLVGAIGGVALGLLGAAIGVLGGRGRAKGFVLGALRVMGAVGLLGLTAGVAALLLGQPYAVYYPLLLLGLICAVVSLASMPGIRKRYQARELQQMEAEDLS